MDNVFEIASGHVNPAGSSAPIGRGPKIGFGGLFMAAVV